MKKRGLLILKICVSAGLVLWFYGGADKGAMAQTLTTIEPALVPLIFLILFVNTVLSSIKWRILLHADGIDVPLRTLVMSYLVGTFFNLFLPSSIGGDAYRIYDVARFSSRPANAFASVFADRLSGFVALVTIGAVAACAAYRRLPEREILLLALAAFAGILVLVGLLSQERLMRRLLGLFRLDRVTRLMSFFDKFMSSIRAYRAHPGVLVKVLGISFCFQGLSVVCIWMMARALLIEAPLLLFFAFVPLINLLEALPISVYGLGVREASYRFFFGYAGMTEAQALSLAAFYLALVVVYSLSGGVIFVVRSRARKPPVP